MATDVTASNLRAENIEEYVSSDTPGFNYGASGMPVSTGWFGDEALGLHTFTRKAWLVF
jgi:predicted house-cleaning NTP pyrophosphatase (Maf/HAM1 superfamily)